MGREACTRRESGVPSAREATRSLAIDLLCLAVSAHIRILPAPQGSAFDAAQYSFFGDLTNDGDLGDLDGALEVRCEVCVGQQAWSLLLLCASPAPAI